MMNLQRLAYLLIAACILLAIPFAFVRPLPDWLPLIGLFGARLYRLSDEPNLNGKTDRLLFLISGWAVVHLLALLTELPYGPPFAGLPLLSLLLMYEFMPRFSVVTEAWMKISLRVTVGLLVITAWMIAMVITAPFAAVIAPVCLLIIAAHHYHAFSNGNGSRTLIVHWLILTVILWIGVGVFSGVFIIDALLLAAEERSAPFFYPLMADWMRYAALAVVLGVGNQLVARLRGENRRITGLSAYWLVTFGVIVGGLVALGAGVVQAYLIYAGIEAGQAAVLVSPVTTLANGWHLGIPLGLMIYLVQFVIRRPKFQPQPSPRG